jgi:hypothetical protein
MSYTVEQAAAIRSWIVHAVSLSLMNDGDTFYDMQTLLTEEYQEHGAWSFADPLAALMHSNGIPKDSAFWCLVNDLIGPDDPEIIPDLVALFLTPAEIAEVEAGTVTSMFDDDEIEYTVEVPRQDQQDPVVTIGISAIGGGTVGRAYADQEWKWQVRYDGKVVASDDNLRSGYPATHAQMAVTLAAFLATDAETISNDTGGELSVDDYPITRSFLEREGERLGIWWAEHQDDE